ncbi:MAG: DsbA family protein [Myxococcota bacterium]
MSLQRKLSPVVTGVLTSPARRRLARRARELRRRVRGGVHRVEYFHQVDDPYAQLVAPLLERFALRYDVELVPVLVGPPDDASAPERERLVAYSRRDAADVAPYYGVAFRDPGAQPPRELVALANAILVANLGADRFAAMAAAVGESMWAGDAGALTAIAQEYGAVDPDTVRRACEAGDARRERLGHYLGATFHYEGEWYWGIERLAYLEERLEELGALRAGARPGERVVARRLPAPAPPARPGGELTLEFFASLRSPYTAISFGPVYDLVDRTGVRLVLRPVLPMVMRGLPVPRAKRIYIMLDTKREAERLGVPFGVAADPIGRPVELGFSLYPFAREKGRAREYLHAFAHLAFSQGVDMGTEKGLAQACERAGLRWEEARPHLGDESWRPELEANRKELLAMGLWGVPSFRLSGPEGAEPFCTWGQDRLWLVEERIRERLAQ